MTESAQRETADRLIRALADTAHQNLPDRIVAPPFEPTRAGISRSGKGKQLRPWALPAAAAAVLLVVTIGAIAIAHRSARSSGPAGPAIPGPATVITLLAEQTGTPLGANQLQAARTIIGTRLAGLGVPGADVRVVGNNELQAILPGSATIDVSGLGAVGSLQFRPEILGAVSVAGPSASSGAGSAVRTVDQWASLGFTPPADAAAYQALTEAQRSAVRSVFTGWDCTNRSVTPLVRPDRPLVTCDQAGTQKYLLGAAIMQSGQVESAEVAAPTQLSQEWSVDLHLLPAGQRQWMAYTTAHNESSHSGDIANVVADVLDSKVITVSTVQGTIAGDTQVSGGYTQSQAKRLAADLTAGSLPRQFDVISVQHR